MAGALAAVLVSASYAGAQACKGNTPFANGRWALGGEGSFPDGANRFGAVGAYGAPKSWYATATIGSKSFKGGGSATDFGGTFGYQIPVGDSPLEFCPYARVGYYKSDPFNTTSYGIGGAVGWPNHVSDDFDFIPAVGVNYTGFSSKVDGSGTVDGLSRSITGNSTALYLNAGLILNKQWGIVPSVWKSLSDSRFKAVFGIALTYNFGK